MRLALSLLSLTLLLPATAALADDPAASGPVYELRTYVTHPGRLDALNKRFREHTTKLFAKHGMTNVGYWVPADDKDGKADTLIYVLGHASRAAAAASWKAFGEDPEWKKAREASEADGPIVKKVEAVFLAGTDYSPEPVQGDAAPGRIFELRTYIASPGKLDDLNKRFREHTLGLFAKHGMTNIGYGTPTDEKDGKGNTLIYLLAHKNREAATASWKAFSDDPEWQKVYKASQPDGVPLAAKVISVYLVPTDYSALK